jgi:signal transduction histidine kinase
VSARGNHGAQDGGRENGAQRRSRLRHDLRTPLTIVSGFAEVLAADRAITDAERRDYAERIHAAAAEIRELVDALVDEQRDGGD